MIRVITGRLESIDRRETLRYLGYRGGDVSSLLGVLDECEEIILRAQSLKACYRPYEIHVDGDDIDLGFKRVKSHSLYLNLNGCTRIALFAATLGAGVDREIIKYERLSPARAAVLQAMGAAAAEQWCDAVDSEITALFGAGRPRFSCGYGDLPLALQRDIFAALEVTKNIGVTLSDSCFMTPTKSVTAIKGALGAGKDGKTL